MSRKREITDQLLQQLEDGAVDWETVARECLMRMRESDVADMCDDCEFLPETDNEEDYDS